MPSHLSAALTQLTPEQQTEYVIAFNKIDTSGDELLQKSEISAALVETGEHVSVSELERMLADVGYRPEYDENGEEVGGMTIDQFIEMMAVHSQVQKGLHKQGFFNGGISNTRMREVAKRNSFKHKPATDGADKMDRFLAEEVKCARCHHYFSPSENSDDACGYHALPGRSEGGRTRNDLEEVTFRCCGRVQKGTAPIIVHAEPCMRGRHVTREELDKIEKEAKDCATG